MTSILGKQAATHYFLPSPVITIVSTTELDQTANGQLLQQKLRSDVKWMKI